MQLTGDQLVLVGGISAIMVEFLKFILGLKKVKMPRTVLTILVMIISLGLGYLWLAPVIAVAFASGDPMTTLGALLQLAVSIVGYATLIYNILLANIIKGAKNLISGLNPDEAGAE
jgi:hypothetical protein